jgi:isoquinoline 1-oxidoreductase subunit beta
MVESDGGKSFDANNNLTALHMRISGQSILAFVNPQNLQNGKDPFVFQGLNPGGAEGAFGYTIPNLLIDHAMRNPHIPPHFWRGVNNNQNAIYLECFMKSSLIPSARTRSSFAAS